MPSHTNYSLGPLPWSDETLVAAVWKNFSQAQQWVDEHPGRPFVKKLESLRGVRRIFEENARKFDECLVRFHSEAHLGHLFRRNRQSDLRAFEQSFQELLYVFASSAMTLVDQARTLSQLIELPGYKDLIETGFATNPKHRFVQELRVDLIHINLHRPGWQLTSGKEEKSTSKFMLWPSQLTRLADYHTLARQFVQENPEGIDLGRLVAEYTSDVCKFHDWLNQTVKEEIGDMITDYQRCTKQIKGVSVRAFWNLILQQVVIAGNRDPYSYLDQYLTEEELKEVNSLPHRSLKQVDRIIGLIDEYEACDSELRRLIYKAFNANA